jgi:hypothetical protein
MYTEVCRGKMTSCQESALKSPMKKKKGYTKEVWGTFISGFE